MGRLQVDIEVTWQVLQSGLVESLGNVDFPTRASDSRFGNKERHWHAAS